MISFRTSTCKSSVVAVAIALSQTMFLAPLAVQAADTSVRVAGQTIFATKSGSGTMTAEARAEAVQRNLDNALVASKDRTPAAVNIVYVKGLPVITLGGYQVVTINSSDAKDGGTTPALLAGRWADTLRNVLRDQSSIESYVAQLSGGYASSAPATSFNATPVNSAPAYQPQQQQQYGGPGPGGYQGGPQGGPPQGAYQGGPPGGPPQYQGGGSPYQQGTVGMDNFNRNTQMGGYGAGYGGYGQQGPQGGQQGYGMQQGRVAYAPAGLVLPVSLKTSISTQAAQSGDLIEAGLTDSVNLGQSAIPAGTTLVGQVTDAKAGGFLGRSGMLGIKFTRLRMPDGSEVPISAHIVGGIGKYAESGEDTFKGETWKTKVGQAAIRGGVGAGTGAALGTAVGAIAGRGGYGAGRGAWSGAAIGGGVGVAQSLIMRKGKEVTIRSGTAMQVQLDAPASISGGGVPPYTGTF